MPWNDTARREHRRERPGAVHSDLTAREWALISPMLPAAKRGGRPRTTDLRAVTDAILYIASSGCQWRMLPKDFPPVSTVQGYFYAWRDTGLWQGINHLLVMSARELEGRQGQPVGGRHRQPERGTGVKAAGFAAMTPARSRGASATP